MTNSELNKKFINSLSKDMQLIILSNIANHYGVSYNEAKKEIFDKDSENILDYVTGRERSSIKIVYSRFMYNINKNK